MPTYEYKCDACGIRFEKFQSIVSKPVKKCPECGKARVQRLIGTGAGLIFKGSGFYITDYRDSGYKEKAKAESGAGSDGKPETKGESKTERKSTSEPKPAESKPKAEPKPAEKPSQKK